MNPTQSSWATQHLTATDFTSLLCFPLSPWSHRAIYTWVMLIHSHSAPVTGLQSHNGTKTHHNDIIYEIYEHGQWASAAVMSLNKYTLYGSVEPEPHVQQLMLQPGLCCSQKDKQIRSEKVKAQFSFTSTFWTEWYFILELLWRVSLFSYSCIFLSLQWQSAGRASVGHYLFGINQIWGWKRAKIRLRLSTWWKCGLWKEPQATSAWVLDTLDT